MDYNLNQTLVMNLPQRMRRSVFYDLGGVRKQSLPVQMRPVNAFIYIFFIHPFFFTHSFFFIIVRKIIYQDSYIG